jgi:hypothetical protein
MATKSDDGAFWQALANQPTAAWTMPADQTCSETLSAATTSRDTGGLDTGLEMADSFDTWLASLLGPSDVEGWQ